MVLEPLVLNTKHKFILCLRIRVLEPLILHLILCFRTPVLEPTKHCMPRPEVTVPDIACMMTQCRAMYWWKTLPEISWSERWGIKMFYKISNKFLYCSTVIACFFTNGGHILWIVNCNFLGPPGGAPVFTLVGRVREVVIAGFWFSFTRTCNKCRHL